MTKSREIFYDSLGQFVNLIKIKLAKHQFQDVERYLSKIDSSFYKVFDLSKVDPEKFLATIYSEEIFREIKNHYQYPNIIDPYAPHNFNYYGQETFYLNDFYADLYYQIWQLMQSDRSEMTIKVIQSIIRKIKFLNQQNFNPVSNVAFLNLIIRINSIYSKGIEEVSLPLFITSNRWYFEITFWNDSLDIQYLPILDQYFLRSIKSVIDNNNLNAFKDLIDTTIRGYNVYPGLGFLHPLSFIDANEYVSDKTYLLQIKLRNHVDNVKAFQEWSSEVDSLEGTLGKISNEVDRHLASLRDYGRQYFLYKNLRKRIFLLGVYCVFKRQYSFVQYLITANSPLDSEAHQLNEDINPIHFKDIYYFFSIKYELEQESFTIWEGHHGFIHYFEHYIVIIIASALRLTLRNGQYDLLVEAKILLGELKSSQLRQLYYDWQTINRKNAPIENLLVEIGFDQRFINEHLKPFIIRVGRDIYRKQKE